MKRLLADFCTFVMLWCWYLIFMDCTSKLRLRREIVTQTCVEFDGRGVIKAQRKKIENVFECQFWLMSNSLLECNNALKVGMLKLTFRTNVPCNLYTIFSFLQHSLALFQGFHPAWDKKASRHKPFISIHYFITLSLIMLCIGQMHLVMHLAFQSAIKCPYSILYLHRSQTVKKIQFLISSKKA